MNVSNVIGNQTLTTFFFEEENQFRQNIVITDHQFVLDKLIVSMYDRTGNFLSATPIDYSFSLEVEYEV